MRQVYDQIINENTNRQKLDFTQLNTSSFDSIEKIFAKIMGRR
jgi:hypothetical protein